MSRTEKEILLFAEDLYERLIQNFNQNDCPFALLTRDDATFSGCPGITSANIRNVLIGGDSSGTATFQELVTARIEYEVSNTYVSYSLFEIASNNNPWTQYEVSKKMNSDDVVQHLRKSTHIITNRIWPDDIQNRYVRRSKADPPGMLSADVIRALFGFVRRQRIALSEINIPIQQRIALLNECIIVCNIQKISCLNQAHTISANIARRAYNQLVGDANGHKCAKIDLNHYTKDFPIALEKVIAQYGFVDTWAKKSGYNASWRFEDIEHESTPNKDSNRPVVSKHVFAYAEDSRKTFWFISIDNAFSKPFWEQLLLGLQDLRFCAGLGGKSKAYVRCASHEEQAIFTTSGRFTYNSVPMSNVEEGILELAKFVMLFQKAYVERLWGSEYKFTWDANLLHHVVGPITESVYGAHSDFGPLLCSLSDDSYKHVHERSFLPTREEMQVLTIYYSNYTTSNDTSTAISYTTKTNPLEKHSWDRRAFTFRVQVLSQ
jgi:hypothetical protein